MATLAKKLITASILTSMATLALYGCIASSGPHAVNSTQAQKISIPGTGLTVTLPATSLIAGICRQQKLPLQKQPNWSQPDWCSIRRRWY